MKKKLLFVIESLTLGGAEKSLVTLLNLLDYSKYDVDLLLFAQGGAFQALLPKEVNLLPVPDYFAYNAIPWSKVGRKLKEPRKMLAQLRYSVALRAGKHNHIEKAVLLWQASHTLSPDEYDVTLLLLEKSGGFLPFVPERVHIKVMDDYESMKREIMDPPLQVAKNYLKEGKYMRAFCIALLHGLFKFTKDRTMYYKYVLKGHEEQEEYDVAIAYCGPFDFLTVYVRYFIHAVKKIQWIHFDVSKFNFNTKMYRKLYPKFDEICVVSEEAKEQLLKEIPNIIEKTITVPNVVSSEQCRKVADMGEGFTDQFDGIRIVTVGRLTEEKGQDIIPEVAAKLKRAGLNFKWYLVGDGKLRPVIEQKCRECDVTESIAFLGVQVNPYQYLKQADLYVQTSIHEGFCITLGEAKAFNLPIVSTDCAGAHEQLDGQKRCAVVQRSTTELCNAILKCLKE